MKKLTSIALSLVMMASMAGCAKQELPSVSSGEVKEPQTEAKAETPVIQPESSAKKLDKPVEIEFWHAMSGGHEEALTGITERFNQENDMITVKLVNQGGYGDLSQKIMAAAKANTLPVMSQAYEDWVTEYIQNDLVTDLTPYMEDPEIGWSEEELNDIVMVFRESNQWDGKYYSLPFNKSTRILFYNKGLFEEKNAKVPETWEDLRTAAEVLTEGKVVGMGFENAIGLEISPWIIQAGGEFIDEDTLEVKFNTPEGHEALTFIRDMIDDGVARLAGEDNYMSGPFGRGDAAMYIGSSAGIPYVAQAAEGNITWSATVLPKGKKAATNFAGTNVTVFYSASEEEKLAAWEYMKVLINTENTAEWAMKTGYLPVRYSALELSAYKQYIAENPEYGVAEKQFDIGFFDARVKGANGAKNAITKEIDAILLGQKTVEQGLADAAQAAQAEIDAANR